MGKLRGRPTQNQGEGAYRPKVRIPICTFIPYDFSRFQSVSSAGVIPRSSVIQSRDTLTHWCPMTQ